MTTTREILITVLPDLDFDTTDESNRWLFVTGVSLAAAVESCKELNTDAALLKDLVAESGRDRAVGRGMERFLVTDDVNGRVGTFAVWVFVGDYVNPLAGTVWKS